MRHPAQGFSFGLVTRAQRQLPRLTTAKMLNVSSAKAWEICCRNPFNTPLYIANPPAAAVWNLIRREEERWRLTLGTLIGKSNSRYKLLPIQSFLGQNFNSFKATSNCLDFMRDNKLKMTPIGVQKVPTLDWDVCWLTSARFPSGHGRAWNQEMIKRARNAASQVKGGGGPDEQAEDAGRTNEPKKGGEPDQRRNHEGPGDEKAPRKKPGKLTAMFAQYGYPFLVWWTITWTTTLIVTYFVVSSEVVAWTAIVAWLETWGVGNFVKLHEIDPQRGYFAIAFVLNEAWEPVRFPATVASLIPLLPFLEGWAGPWSLGMMFLSLACVQIFLLFKRSPEEFANSDVVE